MKKVLMGESNKGQEPVAIRDPINNELIVEHEEIKRVTLKYCKDNLKTNKRMKNIERKMKSSKHFTV